MKTIKKEIDFYKNAAAKLNEFNKMAKMQELHVKIIELKHSNKKAVEVIAETILILREFSKLINLPILSQIRTQQRKPEFCQGGFVGKSNHLHSFRSEPIFSEQKIKSVIAQINRKQC